MNAERLLVLYEKVAEAPDAVPRLRRFVLDLAVRGKLVPQDGGDEPASELLKRIAAEKARLVKAGEIRKPKALPPVDDEPFDLPSNWRWVRIREVTSNRGQRVPDSDFTYIDVTAINKEAGIVAEPNVLNKDEAPSRARKIAAKDDVLYSCVRPYLLNVAILDQDFDPAPIASTAFAVLNGHGLVLPRYLWITLRSPFMVECVEENQRGQAYPAINDADFAVLPFPLPPLAEQRRIVVKVEELMALLDRLEAARNAREATRDRLTAASLARLTAPGTDQADFPANARFALATLPALTTHPDQIKPLRQTILNLAVRGKLVEQDPTDEPASELLKRMVKERKDTVARRKIRGATPPKAPSAETEGVAFPASWELCSLGQITLITDPNPSHRYPDYSDGTVPILSTREFAGDGGWNPETAKLTTQAFWEFQKEICDFAEGDIIFARKGRLGLPRFLPPFEKFTFSHTLFSIKPMTGLDPNYLLWLLRRDEVVAWLTNEMNQNTGVPTLGKAKTERLPIALPPLAEQHRIVAKVDALMALCDRLETSLTTADTTRARLLEALLHEALTPTATPAREAAE
ncbi:restriction endonuclease subunit S [uncultured Jannaschia sp.]|uniref:restriction endonuclease subunit S n=1 Tax=uncultured Jannaschia sp. TaxID=293347 RepID=UPI002631D022|nr:restriction endonuclease subunit S [uncultured Jannaschia sp.]